MPPRKRSRHTYSYVVSTESGALRLTERVPFRFRELFDNIQHTVKEGDTWWSLAGRYFRGIPRPAGLWWIIMDFQPDPPLDPTIELQPGEVIFVPSLRTVQERVFNERRRREIELLT